MDTSVSRGLSQRNQSDYSHCDVSRQAKVTAAGHRLSGRTSCDASTGLNENVDHSLGWAGSAGEV